MDAGFAWPLEASLPGYELRTQHAPMCIEYRLRGNDGTHLEPVGGEGAAAAVQEGRVRGVLRRGEAVHADLGLSDLDPHVLFELGETLWFRECQWCACAKDL